MELNAREEHLSSVIFGFVLQDRTQNEVRAAMKIHLKNECKHKLPSWNKINDINAEKKLNYMEKCSHEYIIKQT